MKQMTCAQMGGPADCQVMIQGSSAEEMAQNGTNHVMQAHPDLAEQMSKMSQEDKDKWMADFRPKFDAQPDMA